VLITRKIDSVEYSTFYQEYTIAKGQVTTTNSRSLLNSTYSLHRYDLPPYELLPKMLELFSVSRYKERNLTESKEREDIDKHIWRTRIEDYEIQYTTQRLGVRRTFPNKQLSMIVLYATSDKQEIHQSNDTSAYCRMSSDLIRVAILSIHVEKKTVTIEKHTEFVVQNYTLYHPVKVRMKSIVCLMHILILYFNMQFKFSYIDYFSL